MGLKQGTVFDSDTVGTNETLTLQTVNGQSPTPSLIASAFYGTQVNGSPKPAVISDDRKQVTFTVEVGFHTLNITVASPSTTDELVKLVDSANQDIADFNVTNHSGVSTVLIQGISAGATQ